MGIPCKIGTMPMVIHAVDGRTKIKVGNTIKIRRRHGSHWERVRVRDVQENGYFQGDLM